MILKDILNNGIEIIKQINNDLYVFEVSLIICHVLNCDKIFLYTHQDMILSNTQADAILNMCKRRATGEPLQYIIGTQEFMSLKFNVNKHVLIPRPETELLVEEILKIYKNIPSLNILDIGTGSGCIAISLCHFLKECSVHAIDISSSALDVAKCNAKNLAVENNIKFINSDIKNYTSDTVFDIIVSNPPYIRSEDINTLQVEVRDYEPLLALDGGTDGLNFYRVIINKSTIFLKHGGMLAFEVGIHQADYVYNLMTKSNFAAKIIKDYSNISRIVIGNLI